MSAALGGIPVQLGNDVDCGALAEARLGAGREYHRVAALFVGTGLGGALCTGGADGKVLQGSHGVLGEVGHVPLWGNARQCACGQIGCLETIASKRGLEHAIREAAARGETCQVSLDERIRSKAVVAALAAGDQVITAAIRDAGRALGWAVAMLAATYDPECVIISGGIGLKCAEFLMPEIQRSYRQHEFFARQAPIAIVSGALGGDAGAIGASFMIADQKLRSL